MTQVSKKENSDSRRFSRMQWRVLIATMIGYTLFEGEGTVPQA